MMPSLLFGKGDALGWGYPSTTMTYVHGCCMLVRRFACQSLEETMPQSEARVIFR